jgi:hypothetical protein
MQHFKPNTPLSKLQDVPADVSVYLTEPITFELTFDLALEGYEKDDAGLRYETFRLHYDPITAMFHPAEEGMMTRFLNVKPLDQDFARNLLMVCLRDPIVKEAEVHLHLCADEDGKYLNTMWLRRLIEWAMCAKKMKVEDVDGPDWYFEFN